MTRLVIGIIFIIAQLSIIYLLIIGSELLLSPVLSTPLYPLGNLLTWLLFILFPLTVRWLSCPKHQFRYAMTGKLYYFLLKASFVMGLLWPLISFLLSGNLANTFHSDLPYRDLRSLLFWIYSFLAPGLTLLALLLLLGIGVINLLIRNGEAASGSK